MQLQVNPETYGRHSARSALCVHAFVTVKDRVLNSYGIWGNKVKRETKQRIRLVSWILFVLYLLLLMYLLFLSEAYGRKDFALREYQYNLEPFREIRRFWIYRDRIGIFSVFLNLGGNIIGFLPFGFMLPIFSNRLRNGWLVGILGFTLSLLVECVQLVYKVGSFDVDDMLLNTLGAVLGYALFVVCNRMRRWMDEKKI